MTNSENSIERQIEINAPVAKSNPRLSNFFWSLPLLEHF